MRATTFAVEGMMCPACVGFVMDEFRALNGVSEVRVEANPAGPYRVTVTSRGDLSEVTVLDAVGRAGFQLPEGHRLHTREARVRATRPASSEGRRRGRAWFEWHVEEF